MCPSGGPACPSGGPASAASGADAHAKCSSGRVLSSRRPLRACRTRCLGAAGGAGPRAAAQGARRAAAFTRAERGKYRARGPFWTQFTLEGFHAGRVSDSAGFGALTAHRVLDINGTIPCSKIGFFQSGTIPAPVWVLKIPGFSTSSPVWSLKIHDFSISDQFGSLPAWVFPFLT